MKKLASLLIYVGLAINVSAQDILFQETFEDDGSDSRYTVEGGLSLIHISEPTRPY